MNKLYDFGYEYVFQFDEEMINDYYLDTGVTANWVVFGANLDIVVIAEMENESSVLMAKRYIEKYFSEAIYYDYTLYSRGNRIYFGKNLLPFLI